MREYNYIISYNLKRKIGWKCSNQVFFRAFRFYQSVELPVLEEYGVVRKPTMFNLTLLHSYLKMASNQGQWQVARHSTIPAELSTTSFKNFGLPLVICNTGYLIRPNISCASCHGTWCVMGTRPNSLVALVGPHSPLAQSGSGTITVCSSSQAILNLHTLLNFMGSPVRYSRGVTALAKMSRRKAPLLGACTRNATTFPTTDCNRQIW